MSAQMLEVTLLGVGTVLRLGRDAWSMFERRRQATNGYAPTFPPPPKTQTNNNPRTVTKRMTSQ